MKLTGAALIGLPAAPIGGFDEEAPCTFLRGRSARCRQRRWPVPGQVLLACRRRGAAHRGLGAGMPSQLADRVWKNAVADAHERDSRRAHSAGASARAPVAGVSLIG